MNYLLVIVEIMKYLGPILLLLALIYDFKLQYISPDCHVEQHKRINKRRYIIVFLAGVLGLIAIVVGDRHNANREKTDDAYRNAQEARQRAFKTQVDRLEKQQDGIAKEYEKILLALATNSTPNPALLTALTQAKERFRVINAGVVDLKSWTSELNQQQELLLLRKHQERLKTIDSEKEYIAPAFPVWDYVIKSFISMLNGLVHQTGTQLSSDFSNLPGIDVLCPGTDEHRPIFDDLRFQVANIAIRTNLSWKCTIIRKNNMMQWRYSGQPTLIIERQSTNGSRNVQVTVSQASLNLPGYLPIVEQLAPSNYEKGVDAVLRGLIAAESDTLLGVAK